jgi:hypothetical protein
MEIDMKITAIVFCAILMGRLFAQAPVQAASAPISKVEPMPTTLRKLGDVYLVDCHVFGGNSGSPSRVARSWVPRS